VRAGRSIQVAPAWFDPGAELFFLPSLGRYVLQLIAPQARSAVPSFITCQISRAPIRLTHGAQQELETALRQLKRTWPCRRPRNPNATEICAALGWA